MLEFEWPRFCWLLDSDSLKTLLHLRHGSEHLKGPENNKFMSVKYMNGLSVYEIRDICEIMKYNCHKGTCSVNNRF